MQESFTRFPKEKATDQCDEKACHNGISFWLKFKSGHMGFYCKEHKELYVRQNILLRVENA